MIDIHAHLLPDIDDGPQTLEQSLRMLKMAEDDGITAMAATPHVFGLLDEEQNELIQHKFRMLKQSASESGINIDLHLASEVFIQPDYKNLLEFSCGTINGMGRFTLLEFSMTGLPFGYESMISRMVENNLTPIIAHPERNNMILRDLRHAQNIVDCGAWLQINSGSLLGDFGRKVRKAAFKLLAMDLVRIVASDAHDNESRPPLLSKARQLVTKYFDEYLANLLFYEHPDYVLTAQPVKTANLK
ncbi:capsule biosynthesis protein CapC [bacterium]|nr:capsule biosynthesis protein CapC [bacterium]